MTARAIGYVVCAVTTCACAAVAYTGGGGATKPKPPPEPPGAIASAVAVPSASASGSVSSPNAIPSAPNGDGYEVALRLVDNAREAHFEGPNQTAGLRILAAYWRKMRSPWAPLTGDAAKLVTSIALRTSATETQWAAPMSSGKAWTPDARVWNMNEGSFDQRESLVAPTPATISYRIEVPAGARFDFAPGSANATGDVTVFVVSASLPSGEVREVGRARLAPDHARKWGDDVSLDLGPYAGQSIELRLATTTEPAAAEERRPVKRDASARDADGGMLPDGLATPGAPSVALWGNPTVLRKTTPRVPYNVLWIVIDALRPDVIAAFHDDADDQKKLAAPDPPLEALLPKVPGLMPSLDALTAKSTIFTHAYSGGAWTRPGTLAMLAGARTSELGLTPTSWVLANTDVARFYASDPPLLPLLLRKQGVVTRAFVNNYFMVGYAPVGVDVGFERVDDHRYRTRDTQEITKDAVGWMEANAKTRFFAFCNYNSPHEPWEPPDRLLPRVPDPPAGPKDRIVRLYMAEAAKDDEAVGELMAKLDSLGIRDHTIVVVTADHGETLSSAHAGTGLDKMPMRFHHAAGNFEETTRIPILISAPGLLPAGGRVSARVRNVDIVPTLLELLGQEPNAKITGRSMVALAKGEQEADERVVVTEGRASRAIIAGKYRLLVHDQSQKMIDDKVFVGDQLYDLEADPGERRNLAQKLPDVTREMRARLEAAMKNIPAAGTHASVADPAEGTHDAAQALARGAVRLRFVGAGAAHRVSGLLTVRPGATARVVPVGLGADAWKQAGEKVELSFVTVKDAAVGFDLTIDPPGAPLAWQLFLDDRPWPDGAVYGGPFGFYSAVLKAGIVTADARAEAASSQLPQIDPARDLGLFVVTERSDVAALDRPESAGDGANEEMSRLLKEWGYAQGKAQSSAPK